MRPDIRTAVLLLTLLGLCGAAQSQQPEAAEAVRSYQSVGRIKWIFPSGFDYYFAVPHFTMGPRIKCKEKGQECEINVLSRDIRKTRAEREEELRQKLSPHAKHSSEGDVIVRSSGAGQAVRYALLTDPRPKETYRLLVVGFAEKGPAAIHFSHLSNDQADVERLLALVERAEALDAIGIWAWRLGDWKAVCEERFPQYREANAAAYAASAFAAVDLVAALRAAFSISGTAEEIRYNLARSREAFAGDFDREDAAQKQAACRDFPNLVVEASK